MTQDFAKKPRRKAPSPKKKKATPKSQTPGWVWLFTGTVLGAFIMFLAYLSGIQATEKKGPQPPVAITKHKPAAQKNDKAIPKPRFDFYQLLEEDGNKPPQQTNATRKPLASDATESVEYLMQVGSFKQSSDADRLRAELLMMNFDTHIEEFKKRNNDLYYRVLVGPYQSRTQMGKDKSTLASNKIDVWVITRKTQG